MRKRIEKGIEAYTRFVCRWRWAAVVATLVAVVALAPQLSRLEVDTSSEGFLDPDDPILETYDEFRDQFGRNEIIVIAIRPPEVFELGFLAKLRAFHAELEATVPHLQEVTSLINARHTRGDADSLVVEDLIEELPGDAAALAMLEARVLAEPQYVNGVISADGRVTTVIIKTSAYSNEGAAEQDVLAGFDDEMPSAEEEEDEPRYLTVQEAAEALAATRAVVDRYRGEDFRVSLAGSPVVLGALKATMTRDMKLFLRLAIIATAICLFLLFRRVSGVVLPLVVVACAVVTAVALMAAAGVPLKMSSMVLPSFLLAVGVGDSMHLLAIFYRDLERSGDRRGAIVRAMSHSGLAVILTSLTTAAGLASFAGADVAPVADLGLFAAIGVLIAMALSLILLPALLAIVPIRPRGASRQRDTLLDRALDRITDLSVGSPGAVLGVSAAVFLLSLAGVAQLRFSHNLLEWLPEDLPARQDTVTIDREMTGTVAVELIVDTGEPNGLANPVVLEKLDRVAQQLRDDATLPVGRTASMADVLKEIHRALNANDPAHYAIADDAGLIAQEILLFENAGSDDLTELADTQLSKARLSVVVPWMDALEYLPFLEDVRERLAAAFAGEADVTVTGLMVLFARSMSAAIRSAAESYVIAFVVITLMMVLLVGRLRDGLVSMIPNLAPIVVTLGFIGWLDLPLDMFTMLIGSIAIGLAVDDTVHFMHNFRREFRQRGEVRESVRQTLQTSGRAMLATTVALCVGFAVFMFGSMNNVFAFGLLTAVTIAMALLADFFLAPALMAVLYRPDKEEHHAPVLRMRRTRQSVRRFG